MVVDRRPHSRVLREGEGEAGDGGSPGPSARGEATWGGTTGRPGAWVRTDERNARSKLDPEIPWTDRDRRIERGRAVLSYFLLNMTLLGGIHYFPSDLHRAYLMGDNTYYLPWYMFHITAVLLWIRLLLGPRGYLLANTMENAPIYKDPHNNAYCAECHMTKPFRAKHCYRCNRCVAMFDHHCPFLATCIGVRNRVFFWAFCGLEGLAMIKCILICWSMRDSPSHWGWLIRNLLLFEAIFFGTYAMGMFILHTTLISVGCLQWDLAKLVRVRAYFRHLETAGDPSRLPKVADSAVLGAVGSGRRLPSLGKLCCSPFACQHNKGFLRNWINFFESKVPRHCLIASQAYPNLDHGLPTLPPPPIANNQDKPHKTTQEVPLSDYVHDPSASSRPNWMVFAGNHEDDINRSASSVDARNDQHVAGENLGMDIPRGLLGVI